MSFCYKCGTKHQQPENVFPKSCSNPECNFTFFRKPNIGNVSVAIIPVEGGKFLAVQRTSAPPEFIDDFLYAFPGGFSEVGETYQEAAAREVWEEMGIKLDVDFTYFCDLPATNGNSLNFFIYNKTLSLVEANQYIQNFVPNGEVKSLVLIDQLSPICFPVHKKVLDMLYAPKAESKPKFSM